jgi:phage terminase large subunit-like protein
MTRADRVIAFIEKLTITSGELAGQPFKLRPWQREILRGIYEPTSEDGRRQIRTALLTVGRKNGKSTLAAALVLAHLLGPEREQRGQVYSAAADRKQAALIFEEAAAMLRADPELAARVKILEATKRIVHYSSGSFYQALSAEHRTAHGFSASCVIYDELAQAPNRRLFDTLTTSTAARVEPLTLVISTQSADPHSIMSELVDHAERVLDGVIEDATFAPFVFRVPDDADPWDEENWRLANPALGDFRSLEEMRAYAATAKRIPAREATFRSLYLNQRTSPTGRLFATPDWITCGGEVDRGALDGRECFAGLDLSERRDLTALVLVFPDDDGSFDVLPFFWLPEDGLQDKADKDRVPYPVWQSQGHLETTPGRSINYNFVVHRLAELSQSYNIREVVYDRWHIDRLTQAMSEMGLDLELAPFGQGFRDMSPAVDVLESCVINGMLRTGGHPVLTMCALNAVVDQDPAGNRKLAKDKSSGRIDGAVALAMALRRAKEHMDENPAIVLPPDYEVTVV